MSYVQRVAQAGVEPDIGRPDPVKVLAGDPVHSTWNLEDKDGLYCGIWQSTPGAWSCQYDEWEYIRILEGYAVLRDSEGQDTHLRAGDSYIIRPGFTGSWTVVETVVKEYVIRL